MIIVEQKQKLLRPTTFSKMAEQPALDQNGISSIADPVEEGPSNPSVPNNNGGEQEKKTRRKKKSRKESKHAAKTDADDARQAPDGAADGGAVDGTAVYEHEWFAVVSGSDLVQVNTLLSLGVDINCINEVNIFLCIFDVQRTCLEF